MESFSFCTGKYSLLGKGEFLNSIASCVYRGGWRALHLAAQNGHDAVVERLLNCQADREPEKEVCEFPKLDKCSVG